MIIFSKVLLPDPLRPMRPTDSPCSIVNDTSLTARKVSLICWRRSAAIVICLIVRWYRIVNCLLAFRATMAYWPGGLDEDAVVRTVACVVRLAGESPFTNPP